MVDASNEWRTLVRCQKPLEMHLQKRKRAELEDFWSLSQENTSENALNPVFSSWGKKGSPNGFFPLFRIGHKSFDLEDHTLKTSTITPCMLPDTFSQGIGQKASSLEGEPRCDPKQSKSWPMLPTYRKRSSGVKNHWKCTCREENRLSSRTSSVRPKKTRARMPRTQFSRPVVRKPTRCWEKKGATQNGPKDGQCFQQVTNTLPMSEATGNALPTRKWIELEDFQCSSQENASVNAADSSSGSVERTHQSRDPKGCTYQSRDPEGYTYQSSDPEGCTHQSSDPERCTNQSSDPERCTYQSSDPEGCTYQSSDPEGYTYPLNRGSDWKQVLGSGQLEIWATTSDDLRAFDDWLCFNAVEGD
ncbi:NBS-LRR type resistance protein [Cucumis melo var. makuwa]|uniref:NBS-LRR type resistance protein n=1 Tax=Cucumis melo var. makuwa TaxID=1194695 RepID=A0A5D3E5W4_CUCMM|nr:NBS-LRR type resistance protein [Cucumis melo var. makuwa]TYK31010.1 NBS-LRR type resistance protein [Cucumis melo var. makuwa]